MYPSSVTMREFLKIVYYAFPLLQMLVLKDTVNELMRPTVAVRSV